MLRTGAGQHEDMEALFATQLRAFGDVTGRPLAGTSGRRHLGGHDSWPPLDAAQWIWLAASQSRRPHRAVSSQVRCRLPCGHPDSTRNPASAYHSVKVTGAPCGKARSAAAFRAGLGSPNSRPAEAREPSRWLQEVCKATPVPSLALRLSLPQ